ncbi:MAG: mannose-1-phosphate guanylyltransferase/mannose-6-phosphate isomerase [Gammaproteobacteria bacterium]|nr:mannose-1-phosphate guanylyltransferase/mannose-6-phosphate isomerase [Gammaproteobacteria bacterium]
MNNNIIPVVLSGGSGTRMWPLSRSHYPKQFLPLVSEKTMLQETLLRLPELDNLSSPMVVCNEDHRFMVAEQLHQLGIQPQAILLEPFGRNTAPAVALAALAAPSPDDILLVLPADHVIADHQALAESIERAVELADAGNLVTFGIVPTTPETGYGYIHRGKELDSNRGFVVDRFVEKPDLQTAKDYLDDGGYYWNSGMFALKAGSYLEELEKFNPDMLSVCKNASEKGLKDLDFCRIDSRAFEQCPSDSIDYAVMEKTDHAVVIPLDAGWNDVGSWSSLWEVSDKDEQGNRLHGDVMTVDTQNSLLHSESRLVASIGLDDIVVIETDDAVMVASKDRVQDVKKIAERLKTEKRSEAEAHRKVYRPWGWYDSIDIGLRHQAKRIAVNPGSKLSLQKHHHRAEHWVVIKGTARITNGDKQLLLTEDQSTYIPIGTMHRLENVGKIPLEIIEVQTGSYLGEDDIERYSDDYGRQDDK